MSPSRRDRDAARQQPRSVTARLRTGWEHLSRERRLAALACLGLFLALFLPWYQETVIARGVSTLHQLNTTFTGWGAFSFVEAAVLLVAAGVLTLLFMRADGRAFHVPGGDGGVITFAGAWTCILLIWRMFDKQGTTEYGQYATTAGVEWGIFVALIVAGLLTYAGTRVRLAHDPEPPLPGGEQYLGPAATEHAAPRPRRRGGDEEPARGRSGARRAGRSRPAEGDRTRDRDWGAGDPAEWSAAPEPPTQRAEPPTQRVEPPTQRAEPPTQRAEPSEPPTRRTEPATQRPEPAPHRARPRSIADPSSDPATEPLVQRLRPPEPRSEDDHPRGGRPPRALGRSDLGDLDLGEPPTSRLQHRPAPPHPAAGGEAEDQLTMRLDAD